MNVFHHWIMKTLAGQPAWLWVAAAGLALLVFGISLWVRKHVVRRLTAWGEHLKSPILHTAGAVLGRTHAVFLAAMGLLAGSLILPLGDKGAMFRRGVVVVALLQAGVWASALLYGSLERWKDRRSSNGAAASAVVAIGFIGQILVWSVVLLLTLDNFGVKVTALLAGLGVGGVAVALALQNVLGDLFASISILLDKPFEVGDFILVGDMMGGVEFIGLKTTRLRSLSGEQIIISNGDLLSSRIRNYKRMRERRVSFTLNLSYETTPEQAAALPAALREIILSQPKIRFDRAHFQKLGDYALVYEVVYFVLDADYTLYMDIQQAINVKLLEHFGRSGLRLAFPTQSLRLDALPPQLLRRPEAAAEFQDSRP